MNANLRAKTALCLAAVAAFLIFQRPLEADVIHLKGGQTLEGKVIDENAAAVKVKTRFGTIDVERSRIERIEYGETKEQEFERRLKAADPQDAGALYELAVWCRENALKKQHLLMLDKVLAADPQHEGANEELGRIRYDGRWFTPSELNAYKQNEAERMKAQGMVWYDGQWMPEHEAKRRMGYELFEGELISQMEYYRRIGERDIEKTFGHPMTITDSQHFTIRSQNPEAVHLELLDFCELEYEHFFMTFKPDETEARMLSYYPIAVYILESVDEADVFLDSGYIKRYNPPGVLERYAHATNFSLYFPRPLVVLTEGRHLVGAEDKMSSQIGFLSHHVGHILIRRFKRGGPVPGWLESGVAHYYEGLTNFHQTVSVCEYEGYEDVNKWIVKWDHFLNWRKNLLDTSNHELLPTVEDLFDLQIETMDTRHMAKAWSVATFLLKTYPEAFVAYARHALAPFRGERSLSNADAWKMGFQEKTPADVEAEWRAWIVQQPPVPQREDRLALPAQHDPEEGADSEDG